MKGCTPFSFVLRRILPLDLLASLLTLHGNISILRGGVESQTGEASDRPRINPSTFFSFSLSLSVDVSKTEIDKRYHRFTMTRTQKLLVSKPNEFPESKRRRISFETDDPRVSMHVYGHIHGVRVKGVVSLPHSPLIVDPSKREKSPCVAP